MAERTKKPLRQTDKTETPGTKTINMIPVKETKSALIFSDVAIMFSASFLANIMTIRLIIATHTDTKALTICRVKITPISDIILKI